VYVCECGMRLASVVFQVSYEREREREKYLCMNLYVGLDWPACTRLYMHMYIYAFIYVHIYIYKGLACCTMLCMHICILLFLMGTAALYRVCSTGLR